MEINRKNWEMMRPEAHKGQGTGRFIDAYLAIKKSDTNPEQAEKNYNAAVALNNHLADVRKLVDYKKYYTAKDQKSWEEERDKAKKADKPFKKSSPEDQAKDLAKMFHTELGKWKEFLDIRMDQLKTEKLNAAKKQTELMQEFGATVIAKYKRDYTVDCLDKISGQHAMVTGKMPLTGDNYVRMMQSALKTFQVAEKKYDIYMTKGGILGKVIEMFKKTQGFDPSFNLYPKDDWHEELLELREKAKLMLSQMKAAAPKPPKDEEKK